MNIKCPNCGAESTLEENNIIEFPNNDLSIPVVAYAGHILHRIQMNQIMFFCRNCPYDYPKEMKRRIRKYLKKFNIVKKLSH